MEDGKEFYERPNGSTTIGFGWFLVAIGVIAALFCGSGDPQIFLIAFAIAQGSLGLGILLISLGYVVRAIWFLPGREIEKPQIFASIAASQCEWCGLEIKEPGRACSQVPHEQFGAGFKVGNDVCKQKLKFRGISVE